MLGEKAALALIQACGGTRIGVPKVIPKAHHLRDVLGDKAFETLCERCGGCEISLPIARYWRFEIYNRMQITRAEMARLLHCTEGLVYRYVQRQKQAVR